MNTVQLWSNWNFFSDLKQQGTWQFLPKGHCYSMHINMHHKDHTKLVALCYHVSMYSMGLNESASFGQWSFAWLLCACQLDMQLNCHPLWMYINMIHNKSRWPGIDINTLRIIILSTLNLGIFMEILNIVLWSIPVEAIHWLYVEEIH